MYEKKSSLSNNQALDHVKRRRPSWPAEMSLVVSAVSLYGTLIDHG